jgi:hypothetical protein
LKLFEHVFYGLHETVAAQVAGTRKFRFKNKPGSVDSTGMDLCLSLIDWAKVRRTQGAVTLHAVLDHDGFSSRKNVRMHNKIFLCRVYGLNTFLFPGGPL